MSMEVTRWQICDIQTRNVECKCEAMPLTLPASVVMVVSVASIPTDQYKGCC